MIELSPAQAADRITALLAASESRTLDFKRISGKQGRMYEAVCAFANTDGGLLVLGIGDTKAMKPGDKPQSRLFGVEENAEGFDDFRRELLNRFTPAITKLHWIRVPCTLHNGQPGMWCCCVWRRAIKCIPLWAMAPGRAWMSATAS